MDIKPDKMSKVLPTVSSDKKCRNQKTVVLHQNVCSLRLKTTELEVLLCSELKYVDVLCLTGHWQSNHKLNCINTTDFKLVSAFCRSSSDHGGSDIYVTDSLETKEISCFTGISDEKIFEMSLTEMSEYILLIVCVYRSPDGQFDKLLHKLELIINKLLKNDKILLLCGDWNMDFMQDSGKLKDLKDLLLRYNLVNTVQSATRIVKSTSTLVDIMIKRNFIWSPQQ
jgi:exonuclease III